MHTNAYQDWSHYYSNDLDVFLGEQLLKFVNGLMPIIIEKDPHTRSENLMGGKVIYHPTSNDFAKSLILLYNNAKPFKEFIEANYFIHLVKPLIIWPTPILL